MSIKEVVWYELKYKGYDTKKAKTWIFPKLEDAKEIYAEKEEEGVEPKLYRVTEIVTRDLVYPEVPTEFYVSED